MSSVTTPGVGQLVLDVTDRDFEMAVIERSRTVPVVVDFWAPWCGPCRVLGPILERLASEMAGAFILAKVNVDQSPMLSRRFSVQSIPMVRGFRDGQMIDGFMGALPESQVRAWLGKLIPSSVDSLAAQAASLTTTDLQQATKLYRDALQKDPSHVPSLLGLGRLLILAGDPEAVPVLQRVPSGKGHAEAQALLNLREFLQQPASDGSPDGSAARYATAAEYARQGQWESAMQALLELVQRDRAFGNDSGRRTLLNLFSLLGETDPAVVRYRRLLANTLF
jgi:putative thioredoxin